MKIYAKKVKTKYGEKLVRRNWIYQLVMNTEAWMHPVVRELVNGGVITLTCILLAISGACVLW